MPKKSKTLCVDDLRHAEYYGMQGTFDELYQKSQNGEVFENLMDLILSRDNILLAYRNIKANKGSYTAGTDKKNITDIGSQTPEDVYKRQEWALNTLARLERTTERRPSVLEAMREQAAKTEPAKKQPAPSHDKESR